MEIKIEIFENTDSYKGMRELLATLRRDDILFVSTAARATTHDHKHFVTIVYAKYPE